MNNDNRPVVNVILCSANDIFYSFPIAVITASLKTGHDPIIINFHNAAFLNNDQDLNRAITSLAQYIQPVDKKTISQQSSMPPSRPEHVNFYLLDVGPSHDRDLPELMSFWDKHESEIVLWVDTRHDWLPNELRYFNYRREVIKWNRTKTPLQLLMHSGYSSSAYWQEAEMALISGNLSKILANPLAKRFSQASLAVRVIDDTSGEDRRISCLLTATDELVYQSNSSEIDDLNRHFVKIKQATMLAKRHFAAATKLFPQSFQNQRPVGHINLETLSDVIDVDDILSYGKKAFPWLCAVEYRLHDNYCLEIASANLDLPIHKWRAGNDRVELTRIMGALDHKIASFQDYRNMALTE
jgi:hypothetical protein